MFPRLKNATRELKPDQVRKMVPDLNLLIEKTGELFGNQTQNYMIPLFH